MKREFLSVKFISTVKTLAQGVELRVSEASGGNLDVKLERNVSGRVREVCRGVGLSAGHERCGDRRP